MIFVSVGTTEFDDLIRVMDELAPSLGHEVVAQIGRGSYIPKSVRYFRLEPSLDAWLDRADVIVTHGGLGTVVEGLERRKPLVAVSNADRYDLHQDDLLGELERRGHLVWCRRLEDLGEAITVAVNGELTPYQAPECRIPAVIRQALGLPA